GTFANTNLGPNGGKATVPANDTLYDPTATYAEEMASIDEGIELYPTPVKSDLTIHLKNNKTYNVVVYDLRGTVVEKRTISSSTKINMSKLNYGIYFVEINDPSQNKGFIKRIIKQ